MTSRRWMRARRHRAPRSWTVASLAAASLLLAPGAAIAQAPPSAPQNLTAQAVNSSRIDLTWQPGSEGSPAVSYNVYRNGTVVQSTASTSYNDTGLQAGTTYTYTVTGVDDKGREGKPSDAVSATTSPDDSPPTTPTGLGATAVSSSRIDLSWSASSDPQSGIDEYRIYRNGSLRATTSGTSYSDTDLPAYTLYEYRVSAVNGAGLESGQSDPASARTLDGSPPTTPTGLDATVVSSSRIDLTWSASSDPQSGIDEYRIYRNGSLRATTAGTSYSDTGLSAFTEYEYRVSAVNGAGLESARSDPAGGTTPDGSPPTTPTGLSATAVSSSRIDLSWSASSDPQSGVAEYRIYRDGSLRATTAGTSYSDTGLSPQTEYEYRVSAVNGAGQESARSDPASATTSDGSPPTTPTGLQATAVSSSRIDLSWTASSDPQSGVAEYRVYRDGSLRATTAGTSYSDTGLSAFTEYEYRVSAVNGDGQESNRSAPASATTLDDSAPTTPTGLQATAVNSSRIDLSWSAASDPQSGIDEYRIYRNGSLAGTAAGTSYSDTGLSAFTEYEYRVSAVNGAGQEGARSAPASARTLDGSAPTTPTGLQATAAGSSRIDLSWTAASDPQSGIDEYRVYRDGSLAGTSAGASYQDVGLSPETEYEYRVSAVNGDGLEGDRSDPASATTPRAQDTTPPTKPEGLQATVLTARQVELSWLPSTDPESGVQLYRVYRDSVAIESTSETTFVDGDLEPDTEYDYYVTAVNGDGLESEPSSNVEVRTLVETDGTPPSAPSGLTAGAVSTSQIDLAWVPAEDPESGISGYRVYRGEDFIAEVTGTMYADVGLVAGTTYSYQVSAVNGDGLEGPRSAVASATTPATVDTIPPAPPTRLRVVVP